MYNSLTMKKYFLTFSLLFSVLVSYAQNSHLFIKGTVENELKEPLMGCNLQVFKDDNLIMVDTTGPSGMFKFDSLYVGHVYDLYFEMEGYSLKFVRIDMKDANPKDLTRFPLEINMALFSTKDIKPESLYFLQSKPYAQAKYVKSIDKIEWDLIYLEKMKKEIEKIRN